MSFESDLWTVLSGDAALAALVGDRIYPEGEAQIGTTFPYVVYSRESSAPQSGLAGFSGGLEMVLIEVNCYARDLPDSALAIAEAVCDAINAEVGANNLRGRCLGETDQWETETGAFAVSLTIQLWHRS